MSRITTRLATGLALTGLGAAIALAAASPALADTAPTLAPTTTSPAPAPTPAPTPKPTPHNPTGRASFRAAAWDRITVTGSASDADSPSARLVIRFAVDGRTVASAAAIDAYHRFTRTLTLSAGRRHSVTATAVNVGGGRDTLLGTGGMTVASLAAQCSAHHPFPGTVPRGTRQVISAVGHSSRSTRGTIRELVCGTDGVWRTLPGTSGVAHFGSAGLGRGSDYTTKTPVGSWRLGRVYTRDPLSTRYAHALLRPGQGCSSSSSWNYNQIEYGTGEMWAARNRWTTVAAQILSNPTNRYGNGSCYFLHLDPWHGPTAGCVGVDSLPVLRTLVARLDPALRPRIVIAIG